MRASENNGELIIYQTDDGLAQINLTAIDGTVWLTQNDMAELFNTTKQNISLHLKNIYEDNELSEISVVKDSLTTAADNKQYQTKIYNLDAILAVGFRVRSPRGSQFRRWANTVLKEYLVKGFAMDDARLKQADKWDYFDEWLARIRDIRASEKLKNFFIVWLGCSEDQSQKYRLLTTNQCLEKRDIFGTSNRTSYLFWW